MNRGYSRWFSGLGRSNKRKVRQAKEREARQRHLRLSTELLEPRHLLAASILPAGALRRAFEVNAGQVDSSVNFLSRGSGYTVFLGRGEANVVLSPTTVASAVVEPAADQALPANESLALLRVQLVGSNSSHTAVGLDPLASKTNYFVGSDPAKWTTNVAEYGRVKYGNVYPGIDQVFFGNEGNLRYDFVLAPGASPGAIELNFSGADQLTIGEDGSLLIDVGGQTLVQQPPVVYQEIPGARQLISGYYVLRGPTQAGFEIGTYDTTRELTIDPTLTFSTYVGGAGTDQGFGIARDSNGDIYIAGLTTSAATASFGTTTIPGTTRGGNDVFVTKLNSAGTAVIWSTILGGTGDDRAYGIAVRGTEAYLTGLTSSTNFPLMMNGSAGQAIQTAFGKGGGGTWDAFVTKLSSAGTAPSYSTYLGGSGDENASGITFSGAAIAIDSAGNAWVTGMTTSTNFTTTPNAFQPNHASDGGNRDAFVTRINAAGTQIDYSSYLGGTSDDQGQGIAVDVNDKIYVTGAMISGTSGVGGTNFPVTSGALQNFNRGSWEAYAAKIDPTIQTVSVSGTAGAFTLTFNGQTTSSLAFNATAAAVQSALNSLSTIGGAGGSVSGTSSSGVYTIVFGGAFAGTIQPLLSVSGTGGATATASGNGTLVYSTLVGGTTDEYGQAIAVDATGHAYVTGLANSQSNKYPVANALQRVGAGSFDVFVVKLNPTGTGRSTRPIGAGLATTGARRSPWTPTETRM